MWSNLDVGWLYQQFQIYSLRTKYFLKKTGGTNNHNHSDIEDACYHSKRQLWKSQKKPKHLLETHWSNIQHSVFWDKYYRRLCISWNYIFSSFKQYLIMAFFPCLLPQTLSEEIRIQWLWLNIWPYCYFKNISGWTWKISPYYNILITGNIDIFHMSKSSSWINCGYITDTSKCDLEHQLLITQAN